MTSKERVTIVLACNSTGSCRIPPLIIGKSQRPFCLRKRPSAIPYTSQKAAWMDRVTCQRWFDDVFRPAVRRFTSDDVALLWDGAPSHKITNTDPKIHIILLPPNTTASLQPLDQGIIASLKRRYRKAMMKELISFIDQFGLEKKSPGRGLAGLADGAPPNIADVCALIEVQWSALPNDTFVNCFRKSTILGPGHSSKLLLGKQDDDSFDFSDVARELQRIHRQGVLSLPPHLHSDIVETLGTKAPDLEAWVDFEQHCVSDIVDELEGELDSSFWEEEEEPQTTTG